MSFSGGVKEELAKRHGNARHCQIAELTAIICMCGKIKLNEYGYYIVVSSDNSEVIKKTAYLTKKILGIELEIVIHSKKADIYQMRYEDADTVREILEVTKLTIKEEEQEVYAFVINPIIIQNMCCRRCFLRGAFLVAGSVSNPEKAYHFEIVCNEEGIAEIVKNVLIDFEIDAKIVLRKKYFVVYVKEGAMIVDVLNIMEAHGSLMDMENVRIVKSVRNNINRRVNCEAANINKTVNAAKRQMEDIKYIIDTNNFKKLNPELRQLALIRLEDESISLKELGEMLDPPVGKSGVNHRLRKICNIANDIRENNF